MARTLAVVLGAVCVLWASVVSALGLGQITLHSALNQNFDAEIRLLQIRDLGDDEIIPRLASAADFERIGVERFFFLTSLGFELERRGPEEAVIRITSRQPVTEPYLNFLVEVLWPNGRLLKEYTVLLDPPAFTKDEGVAPVSPARAMVQPDRSAGIVVREDVEIPLPEERVERPAPLPAYTKEERFQGDTYGMTDRDDTMWSIALMTRPSRDVSVQQTMLAYVRLNGEAFIGNNVNLVKAGFVLRVPTEEEIRRLSQREAVAAVMRHNELWEAYRFGDSLKPIDASEPSRSRTVAETGGGELPLVSRAESGQDAATGASDVTRGANEMRRATDPALIAAQEERDGFALQNEELRESQRMLESQNENVRRQLQIKDEQLAQLQQQLEQVRRQLDEAQQPPEPQQPAGQTQPETQPQTSTVVAPPAPEATTPVRAPFFAMLMDNIVPVGAALALVVVLIVVLRMLSARREAAFEDVSFEDEFEAFDSVEQEDLAEQSTSFLALEAEDEDEAQELEAEDDFGLEAEDDFGLEDEEEEGDAEQAADVISEADIYIAYGRFPQAISFLQTALATEPNRTDVRLKLMEVYVETKDLEGFTEHSKALIAQAGNDEAVMRRARQLQARLPGAESIPGSVPDEELSLSDTLVGGDEVADEARAAIDDDGAPSLDFDLNLDDADLEDSDDVREALEDALDFDLDLESDDEEAAAAEPLLDLDLQLDEDSQASPMLDELQIDQEADELDLELDLDEEAFTPVASGEHPAVDLALTPEEEAQDDDLEGLELLTDDDEAQAEPAEQLLGIAAETQEFDLSSLDDQLSESAEEEEDAITLSTDDDLDLEFSLDDDEEQQEPEASVSDVSSRMPEDLPEPATPTAEFDLSELDLDRSAGGADIDDDVELLSDAEDEATTKLSLARAYIDMGDTDGARDILNEVTKEGSEEQRKEAHELLSQLS